MAKAAEQTKDLFNDIADQIAQIEREAAERKKALEEHLNEATAQKISDIKLDLQKLSDLTGKDFYALLDLRKPSVGRASSGSNTTSTGERAARGTAQGQAKKGHVYSCPGDFVREDGRTFADADEAWQTGARGVPNPKPEWLEAWLKAGKRWADLPQAVAGS